MPAEGDDADAPSCSGRTAEDSTRLPQSAYSMSLSQESELHELFEDIDRNHSGRIEADELKARCCLYIPSAKAQLVPEGRLSLQGALQRLGLPYQSPEYTKELLQQFDSDGDGAVGCSLSAMSSSAV